jgi:3-hydroxybutyryl-CoA dehydrogenase
MSRAVVIGGGTMGAGIAAVLARGGMAVTLVETSDVLAARAVGTARELLDEGVRRGKIAAAEASAAQSALGAVAGLDAVEAGADVVIEAVPERRELKRDVLRAAEQLEPALLATNTSGISIDELADGLNAPERFLGLHFFNPVPVMALVEIVVGTATAQATVDAALRVVGLAGKEPVIVRDAPGFATSRLGVALGLEAIRMVEQGVADPAAIDRAMELGYRHPVGPLRLTDLVGLDVRLDIARNLMRAYGERFSPPRLLEEMVADGRLGKKTGQGFYAW